MLTVTRVFDFCYGHHLPEYSGKCLNFHGHNSRVEIEVEGTGWASREITTPYPGMVTDFGDMKKIVLPILEQLDHKNLNEVLPDRFQPPTAENITKYLVGELSEDWTFGSSLVRVRVSETPDTWAEWRRDHV